MSGDKLVILDPLLEYPLIDVQLTLYGGVPPDITKLISPSESPLQLTSSD